MSYASQMIAEVSLKNAASLKNSEAPPPELLGRMRTAVSASDAIYERLARLLYRLKPPVPSAVNNEDHVPAAIYDLTTSTMRLESAHQAAHNILDEIEQLV